MAKVTINIMSELLERNEPHAFGFQKRVPHAIETKGAFLSANGEVALMLI